MIRISRALAVTSFAALIAASGCSSGTDSSAGDGSATVEETTFASSLGVDLPNSTRTENGAYYRDIVVGTGASVSAGQLLTINVTAWLSDGTPLDGNTNLPFHLGLHEVISGWDETIPGMHVGGKRQVIIPPALGYGAVGSGPIPGNAVLVFTIEVVSAR